VPVLPGIQEVVAFQDHEDLMDTGNLLAVPAVLLRQSRGRLSSDGQYRAESCIEFMLRGD